jgi:integrase
MPKKPFDSYTKYALSETEIKRCLEKCDTTEKEVLVRLGIFYGFRRDDMRKLEIKNIDFVNRRLNYYEEKKDAWRYVPMNDEIEICLKRHINTMPKDQKFLFKNNGSATLYRRFNDILLNAGIPIPHGRTGTPFHALRGTAYKLWRKKGMPVEQVAEMLGDTVETAMEHYGKATMDEIADTIRKKEVI